MKIAEKRVVSYINHLPKFKMSVELNETIETVKRYANLYIEEMYRGLLNLDMYALHTENLTFMVSEVSRNHVYLAKNPFYKWLLEQESTVERTNALAFMWRHAFLTHLYNLNIICSTIMNRQLSLSFRKRMMNEDQGIKYNESSIYWISNYINRNRDYICDYIDAGNVFLK